ncbi:hypothetical protein L7F22_033509 [Adiantum nelumboides]|nr:hypothetical protein [Adiantum nelumboides]
MNHLRKCHEIQVDIPRRNAGRPKNCEKSPLPSTSRSHKQSMTRFANIKVRVSNARRKHLKDFEKLAPKRWKFSSSNGKMPYETWKEKFVKFEMKEWEAGMFRCVALMQTCIEKGYASMASKHQKRQQQEQEKVNDHGDVAMGIFGESQSVHKFAKKRSLPMKASPTKALKNKLCELQKLSDSERVTHHLCSRHLALNMTPIF